MYTGEIQAMWLDIRPKEHKRTKQKTFLTDVHEKFRKGFLAVVDSGGLRPE